MRKLLHRLFIKWIEWSGGKIIKKLILFLEKQSKLFWILTGFILNGILGIIDYITGEEITLSLFYLIPISLITWFSGRKLGILFSAISAVIWTVTDIALGLSYSHPIIYYWEIGICLGFFVIVTLLLSALRMALEREKVLSITDFLTGAMNSRFFYDAIEMEIYRLSRYQQPFTLVYLDLDNFKSINDQFGHSEGDKVLRVVVDRIKLNLRKTDVVARLGGDEFAILLPQTNRVDASVAVSKIQQELWQAMNEGNWGVTFSVGVLTCIHSFNTVNDLVKMVDDLMYTVKKRGKNAIHYFEYQG
jgi:diguanylate cyclase (GGDEF)-like protein